MRLIVFLAALTVIFIFLHLKLEPRFDFGVFYYAARMVWDGHGAQLHDLNAQHVFQNIYHRPGDLPFISPAFALLPFFPFVLAPIGVAFVMWTVTSVGLCAAAVNSLSRRVGLFFGNWPVLLSFAFLPVSFCLVDGQLSILVFAAYVWSFCLMSDQRRFAAGFVLALASVKFQLVTGFVAVLLLKRKWRELGGFVCGCIPLAMAWIMIVGWRGFLDYPMFLLKSANGNGIYPYTMANLRGLAHVLLGPGDHFVFLGGLSLAVLMFAASSWKDLDSGFASAVMASMLTSHHFNAPDLTLGLIPVFLATKQVGQSALSALIGATLMLPLIIASTGWHFALFVIPMLAFFGWIKYWKRQPAALPMQLDDLAGAT